MPRCCNEPGGGGAGGEAGRRRRCRAVIGRRAGTPLTAGQRRRLNLAGLVFALAWLGLLGLLLSVESQDFGYYRLGALNQLGSGTPYVPNPDPAQPRFGYLYPPPLAYLLQPLAPLPLLAGLRVWFALNLAALGGLMAILLRTCEARKVREFWGVALAGTVLAPPTWLCLQLGQTGILLALLIVAGFALRQRSAAGAGALLGAAAAIKLYPGLLGLFYLLARWRRLALWSGLAFAALIGLSIAAYGLAPYETFVREVMPSASYPYAAEFNLSLLGFWRRAFSASDYAIPISDLPGLATALTLASAAALGALCLWSLRARDPELLPLQFSLWLCAMLLLSPVNGSYNLILMLFPLLAALAYRERRRLPRSRLLIVSTALLCWPPTWSDGTPLYLWMHTGVGTLLLTPAIYGLFGYALLLARLIARHQPADGPAAA